MLKGTDVSESKMKKTIMSLLMLRNVAHFAVSLVRLNNMQQNVETNDLMIYSVMVILLSDHVCGCVSERVSVAHSDET